MTMMDVTNTFHMRTQYEITDLMSKKKNRNLETGFIQNTIKNSITVKLLKEMLYEHLKHLKAIYHLTKQDLFRRYILLVGMLD